MVGQWKVGAGGIFVVCMYWGAAFKVIQQVGGCVRQCCDQDTATHSNTRSNSSTVVAVAASSVGTSICNNSMQQGVTLFIS